MAKIAVKTPNGYAIIDEDANQFYGFYRRPAVNQALNQAETRLADIDRLVRNSTPANPELLVWAKAEWIRQHNLMDYGAEIAAVTAERDRMTEYLALIDAAIAAGVR